MNNLQISTYCEPRWGSKAAGLASLRKDNQAYYLDNVRIADTKVVGLFTVLTCIDNTTHYVLTAFFHLADRAVAAAE